MKSYLFSNNDDETILYDDGMMAGLRITRTNNFKVRKLNVEMDLMLTGKLYQIEGNFKDTACLPI